MSPADSNPTADATTQHAQPTQLQPDVDDANEDWRDEHPYKTPTPAEIESAAWQGSCHCGTVRYYLSREEPLASKYCHCSDCQTMHGVGHTRKPNHVPFASSLRRSRIICPAKADRDVPLTTQAPFQWAAIFHKSDLRFARGTHNLAFYTPTLRRAVRSLPCKVSCATCRSPIMDEGRNMIMLFPELIEGIRSARGREAFEVKDHICWPARVVAEGAFEGDGVRKWAGVDGRSELLDDGEGRGKGV